MPRKLLPSGKRDYKNEYAHDQSSTAQKKHRAARNAARRKSGLKVGDSREVDHKRPLSKGGSTAKGNTRIVSRAANRKKGAKTSARK